VDDPYQQSPFAGMDIPREFVNAEFFLAPDMLGGITGEKRRDVFRRFGEHNRRKHANLLRALDRLLRQCNPMHALAHFAYYDQMVLRGKDDGRYKPIEQHSLEFFQAYFLTYPIAELRVRNTNPWVFVRLNCVLRALAQSFSMLDIDRDVTKSERSANLVAQTIRLHTLGVRNAGFVDQLMAQLRSVFSRLDSDHLSREGIRLTPLITMWERLMKVLTERLNAHVDGLSGALSVSDPEKRIRAYCAWRGYSPRVDREMLEALRGAGGGADSAAAICINDADRLLPQLYVFDLHDFIAAFAEPVDEEALLRTLVHWSYSPQGLVGHERANIFLDNPIWDRPLVQMGQRRFYWPILEIFHSFGLDMLESLVSRHSDLRQKYFSKARANYLPERVAELMRLAFPMGQVFCGSQWRNAIRGKHGENDVLVVVDAVALVIECKSGRFTDKSRRGHPQRLKKDIEELLNSSAQQTHDFVQFLHGCDGPVELKTLAGETNRFDPTKIHHYIRFTVTLDFLGPFVCAVKQLAEAGLLSEVAKESPTISLVDLENSFDLLDSPLQKLHYLKRRTELPPRLDMSADELDLLALYLANGFNLGELENMPDQHVRFDWLHKQIEPYFYGRSVGRPVVKPRLKLTQWWREILDSIEAKQFESWTLAGLMMLDLAEEEQKALEQSGEAARSKFRVGEKVGEVENIFIHVPPSWRDASAIAYVICNTPSKKMRDGHIREALDHIQKHTPAKVAFVIARSLDESEGPYWATVVCIF
jgi:hypothetical protein